MNEIAKLGEFSLDLIQDDAPAFLPVVRFKKGEFLTKIVGEGEEDIRGALFCPALPTFRETYTAWGDDQPAPLQEIEAFVGFGEMLPAENELPSYPQRTGFDGQKVDPWQKGSKIDGFLWANDTWNAATFAAGTITAMIQVKNAIMQIKKAARTYAINDWSPVWVLKPGKVKSDKWGDIHVPGFTLVAFVKADGTVKETDDVGKTDLSPLKELGDNAPTAAVAAERFALPGSAGSTGNSAPQIEQEKPAGASDAFDDAIPF